MLTRRRVASIEKNLKPDKLEEVGPTRCPQCGTLAASVHYRVGKLLVCRDCREKVKTFGLPG